MNGEVQKLLDAYLQYFPEEQNRHDLLKQQLQEDTNMTTRKNFIGHVTANATILNPKGTHIFLVHHKVLDKWFTPGGHFEEGDSSMLDNALREAKEETGFKNLTVHPFHEQHNFMPIDIDSHEIPENPKKEEPAHVHHDFRYIFILENDEEITLQEEEVLGGKWFPISQDTGNESTDVILRKLRNIL